MCGPVLRIASGERFYVPAQGPRTGSVGHLRKSLMNDLRVPPVLLWPTYQQMETDDGVGESVADSMEIGVSEERIEEDLAGGLRRDTARRYCWVCLHIR